MNFRRSYSKFTVIRAMIQGVGIGLVAILVIGLTIFSTGGKGAAPDKTVTTSGPSKESAEEAKAADGDTITLFVKQHGVFSSKESATDFAAALPSLANASIVQVSDQFYIWGAVWLKESQVVLKEGEDAFKKKIQLAPGTCKTADIKQVEKALLADDLSKIDLSKDGKDGKDAKKESDLEKKITAISAFTKDTSIARLHLLAHYSSQDPCFKIQF